MITSMNTVKTINELKMIEVPMVNIGYPASACIQSYHKAAKPLTKVLNDLFGRGFVVLCCSGTSGFALASSIIRERSEDTIMAFVRRDLNSPHHSTHRMYSVESHLIKPTPKDHVPESITRKCQDIWNHNDHRYHMVFVDDFMETGQTFYRVYKAIASLGKFNNIEGIVTMSSYSQADIEHYPDSIRFLTYFNH